MYHASSRKVGALVALYVAGAWAAAPYCLAGQPCFPSHRVLAKFNATVDGALIEVKPYGAACYAATYDAEECATLISEKEDSFYRDSLPGMLKV